MGARARETLHVVCGRFATLYYDFEAERFTARVLFDGSAGIGDSFDMLSAGD